MYNEQSVVWGHAYVPDLRSEMTDGRMQIGGTSIRVRIRSVGRPMSGFIISSGMSCHKTNHVRKLFKKIITDVFTGKVFRGVTNTIKTK